MRVVVWPSASLDDEQVAAVICEVRGERVAQVVETAPTG
jgi:hypothetical protein